MFVSGGEIETAQGAGFGALTERPDLFLNIQPTSNEMQRQSTHGSGPQM